MTLPRSFAEFWPYYCQAHQDARCRAMHYVGTAGGGATLVAAIASGNPLWVLAGLVWGYGLAWAAHLAFERNKPAAWVKPWWSFLGDWKMLALAATGRLGPHLRRARDLPNINDMIARQASGRRA